ncbi:DUF3574 domain-containing protein [Plastoroseomonas hellenica]|nr:DUF3574 domain-containing protein [Plastoroseomonas hellenica]
MLAFAGCAPQQQSECLAGTRPMVELNAYLGGNVSEADWQRFQTQILTPAFPEGMTVAWARGQWRNPDNGRQVREATRVLTILAGEDTRDRFNPVENAYRERFRQRSVLVTTRRVCGSL